VVLLLEDIELVRGAPGVRRNFLDVAIAKAEGGTKSKARSQEPRAKTEDGADSHHQDTKTHRSEPEEPAKAEGGAKSEARSQKLEARGEEQGYIGLMGRYRRSVGQYNRLLELGTRDEGRGTGNEVAAWEEEVVRTGVPVYEARLAKVDGLLANAARHYERLAGHKAVFSYRSSIESKTGTVPRAERSGGLSPVFVLAEGLAAAFRERLAATRERARYIGHAVVGPHRDDIRITRGDRELRKFGSVGEQRLAGIALRLAEADMILKAGRQRPVFLLDEVASELDEQRSRMVLEMVAERGQMVYAAARRIAPPREGSRDQGIEGSSEEPPSAARDAASPPDHLTTGPFDHSSGKEFHVEAGKVTQVP
jgi:recombinational DNA repair ATPase RecF